MGFVLPHTHLLSSPEEAAGQHDMERGGEGASCWGVALLPGRMRGPGLGCMVSPALLMVFILSVPGSLAVSVADMTAPVVGSSGGVYALVSAHLANIVMVSSLRPQWVFLFLLRHRLAWTSILYSSLGPGLLSAGLTCQSHGSYLLLPLQTHFAWVLPR